MKTTPAIKPAKPAVPAVTVVSLRAGGLMEENGGSGRRDGGAPGELPGSLLLLKWGTTQTPGGPVIVNETTLAALRANQAAMKRPTVKGDFEHESLWLDYPAAAPAGKADLLKHPIRFAVASARPDVVRGEGIYVRDLVWTEEGREHCPQHYGDASAAPILNERREVIGLHSFAVCQHGQADGIVITPGNLAALSAALSSASPYQSNSNPKMDTTQLLINVLRSLGVEVADDATPEALTAAAETAMAKKPTAEAPAPEALSAKPGVAIAANGEIAAQLAELKGQIAALSATQAATAVQGEIDAALMAGKVVALSAEALGKLSAEERRGYLDSLPAGVVPTERRTPLALSAGKTTPRHDPEYLQGLRMAGFTLNEKGETVPV